MFRNILGSLLALAGAAAGVRSPFRPWYAGRHGSDIRVDDLFTGVGVTPHGAAPLDSLFLPMGFAALLTLLGVLTASRAAVALAGVLVLGITLLWTIRQARFAGSLTAGGNGLGTGVALAVLGGLLLFLGAHLMADPRPRRAPAPGPVPPSLKADADEGEGEGYGFGYDGEGTYTGDGACGDPTIPPPPPYRPTPPPPGP